MAGIDVELAGFPDRETWQSRSSSHKPNPIGLKGSSSAAAVPMTLLEIPMRTPFARPGFLTFLAAVAAGAAFATVSVAGLAQPRHGLGSPVAFLRGVVRELAANDYARAWQTLAPGQQRLVPKGEYVRCESASPIPGHLAWIKVVRAYEEPVIVAGTGSDAVDAEAVTFRLKITEPGLESVVLTHTVHAVPAGERWAWILPANRLELHRSGTCGAGPTGAPE